MVTAQNNAKAQKCLQEFFYSIIILISSQDSNIATFLMDYLLRMYLNKIVTSTRPCIKSRKPYFPNHL